MGLQNAVDDLAGELRLLADAVGDLRLTAVEDRPAGAEQLVLDSVSETVEELTGWVFEALAEVSAAQVDLTVRGDREAAVRRLVSCQQRLNRLWDGAWTGLVPYGTYDELLADPDLDAVREAPAFKAVLAAVGRPKTTD